MLLKTNTIEINLKKMKIIAISGSKNTQKINKNISDYFHIFTLLRVLLSVVEKIGFKQIKNIVNEKNANNTSTSLGLDRLKNFTSHLLP